MTTWFADTSYYLALLNSADELHAQAAALTPSIAQRIVATAWVLSSSIASLGSCRLFGVV